jgi:hypothetical protein
MKPYLVGRSLSGCRGLFGSRWSGSGELFVFVLFGEESGGFDELYACFDECIELFEL